jgi:hypothetical protein
MESKTLLPCSQERTLVSILSQMNLIHALPIFSLRSILTLSSYLCIDLPSHLFPLEFPTNIFYALPFSPIYAECPAHLMHLDLIIKEYLVRSKIL